MIKSDIFVESLYFSKMLPTKLCIIILIITRFLINGHGQEITLYDGSYVIDLTANNYQENVINKSFISIIEIYSHNCGYCKLFAPKYIEFAKNIKDWYLIVRLYAINCAQNGIVCKKINYDSTVPKLIAFWIGANRY